MKKELIEFMEKQEVLGYRLDGGSEYIVRECIDQFFDQYQPERLNPEDHIGDVTKMICDSPSNANK
jgi:hypothetical protein